MSEEVAVPLSALARHEGWWHLNDFEDAASIRRQYRIIQLLKFRRGSDDNPYGAPDDVRDADMQYMGTDWTAEDASLALIRRRCVRRRRDGDSWTDIAKSLGMTIRTLWKRRQKAFDVGHPLHPESPNGEVTHKKP